MAGMHLFRVLLPLSLLSAISATPGCAADEADVAADDLSDILDMPGEGVDRMSHVAPGVNKKAMPGTSQTRAYATQNTTNLPTPGRKLPSEYADLPTDALSMIDHQGQLVVASRT